MVKESKIIVSHEDADKRLDKFLSENFAELSRSQIQNLIKDESILVNDSNVKTGYSLKEEDEIIISIPDLKEPDVKAEDISLDVVFEDEDLIVINKTQGMITHPATGVYSGTLVNAILHHCKGSLSGINGVLRPGIVHRLDKETSGLIIVCKNDFAHRDIAEKIKNREVKRSYYAIVHGKIKHQKGTINKPIGRHKTQRHKMAVVPDGREAITMWNVLKNVGDKHTFVECNLQTGRTHQIRVHMASLNFPIVGDVTYGKKNDKNLMMLHAYKLVFKHPRSGEDIELETEIPDRMSAFL